MAIERFRLLAGVIAAHPEGKVVGRTRLQKEIKLLQCIGFPTNYSYSIHFYGPYSESLHSDIGLLQSMGFVTEEEKSAQDGKPYFIIHSCSNAPAADVTAFAPYIQKLAAEDAVVLELAATYNAFRECGDDHEMALERLRNKKKEKCSEGREARSFEVLESLGIKTDSNSASMCKVPQPHAHFSEAVRGVTHLSSN